MRKKMPYNEVVAKEVCEAVSTSTLGIRALCKRNKHWPSFKVIHGWRYEPSLSFGELYARAKQAQIDLLVDRIFTLTRDKKRGYLTDQNGKLYADNTYLTKIKLEIDAIKWLAAKLSPRVYGEPKGVLESQDAISTFKVTHE